MFNSNTCLNTAPLRDIMLENLNYLDVLTFQGHSRSNVIVPLDSPYMQFLLMFISNIWPNSAPLQDIRLLNLSDLEIDLSMSLRVNVK